MRTPARGFAVLDPEVVVRSRRPETLELGKHAGSLRQLRSVDELAVAHFREVRAQRRLRLQRKRKRHARVWTGRLAHDEEVVIVLVRRDRLSAGVPEDVLDEHLRLPSDQPDRLRVPVGIPQIAFQLVDKLDAISCRPDRPAPGIDDVVRPETLIRAILGLAEDADADPHEGAADRRLLIPEAGIACQELLDRSHDGVVDLRVVLVEPLTEIFATAHAQAGDLPRPVESGPAVVAALSIGQIEPCRDRAVGNLRLRKFRGRQEHGGHGEREQQGSHDALKLPRHFVGSGRAFLLRHEHFRDDADARLPPMAALDSAI